MIVSKLYTMYFPGTNVQAKFYSQHQLVLRQPQPGVYQQRWDDYHLQQLALDMSFDENLDDDLNSSIKCRSPARSRHCRLTNEPPSHDDLVDEAPFIHEARCGQEHATSSPLTLPRTSAQLPKRPHLSQHILLTPSPTTTSPLAHAWTSAVS